MDSVEGGRHDDPVAVVDEAVGVTEARPRRDDLPLSAPSGQPRLRSCRLPVIEAVMRREQQRAPAGGGHRRENPVRVVGGVDDELVAGRAAGHDNTLLSIGPTDNFTIVAESSVRRCGSGD